MELLEQLEQQVLALLARVDALNGEKAGRDEAWAEERTALAEENRLLREELQKEQDRNRNALERVEALLARIKERAE